MVKLFVTFYQLTWCKDSNTIKYSASKKCLSSKKLVADGTWLHHTFGHRKYTWVYDYRSYTREKCLAAGSNSIWLHSTTPAMLSWVFNNRSYTLVYRLHLQVLPHITPMGIENVRTGLVTDTPRGIQIIPMNIQIVHADIHNTPTGSDANQTFFF